MRYGGGFRLLAALLAIGVVAALTAGAYGAGYVAGAGSNAANVSPWVYGGFFGVSQVVGLIVTIFILVVMFRLMRFAFWRHAQGAWNRGGPRGSEGPTDTDGPAGPGDWGWRGERWHGERWQSARQAAFDEWHRRAHDRLSGEAPANTPTSGTAG
ncbi:MAG: hypothetical protein ABSA21_04940 [Candidatus Limnocylindrales bacterium]|jgi:uncharacterized membrane protein